MIKEFIEKAIEGGFEHLTVSEMNFAKDGTIKPEIILMRPEAWQAVGKVEGWNGREYFSGVYKSKQVKFIQNLQEGQSIEDALNNVMK